MKFLIWSNSHKAWWRPDGQGYTSRRAEAGRYTFEDLAHHRLNRTTGDKPGNADVLVLEGRP